jgi:hypothetical protein
VATYGSILTATHHAALVNSGRGEQWPGTDRKSPRKARRWRPHGLRWQHSFMIESARLVRSIGGAAWLPAGGTAEIWAGDDVEVPEPSVIVRLLVRRDEPGGADLFCVRTPKGLDLPSLFLDGLTPAAGVRELALRHLGRDVATRCVGFVRNVVPVADDSYRLPVPEAHVPVFTPRDASAAPVGGTWAGAAEAPALLAERHWWLIASEALGWPHG